MLPSVQSKWLDAKVLCPGARSTQVEGLQDTDSFYARINKLDWTSGGEVDTGAKMCWVDFILSPHGYERCYVNADANFSPITGPIAFAPPGIRLRHKWQMPQLRTLSCLFDPARITPLSAFHWDWSRIDLNLVNRDPNSRLRVLLSHIAAELRQPGFASEVQVESLITLLACEIRTLGGGIESDDESHYRLSNYELKCVRERIEGSLNNLPSLTSIAQEFGLDARRLSSRFKAATGQTLRQHIAQSRVRRAKLLLSDRRILIKQVAYQCGFSSIAAFSAAFRRTTGMSPGEFRLLKR